MKISELIEELQTAEKIVGDIEVWIELDGVDYKTRRVEAYDYQQEDDDLYNLCWIVACR